MRLHRLEVTAFGPFAQSQVVDFDTLGASGLFLLAGPTGAGKTSILDAVCFALFGAVPGDRNAAARLRSDHADETLPPRVQLELTVAERRLLLTRSPAWARPKRRGSGVTVQPAAGAVAEQVDGSWQTLSTRTDEVADLVRSVLGMSISQFTQVAMLPQGRFADFLRAGSADRLQVLEQLFGTARFRSMERWLVEHRRATRRADDARATTARTQVDSIAAAAVVPPPPDDNSSEAPGDTGLVGASWVAWAGRVAANLRVDTQLACASAERARKSATAARSALAAAQALHITQERGAQARRLRAGLDERQPEVDQARRRLSRADRARESAALLESLRAAERLLEQAGHELHLRRLAVQKSLTVLVETLPDTALSAGARLVELEADERQLHRLVGELERALEHRARHAESEHELTVLTARRDELRHRLAEGGVAHDELPERINRLSIELAAAVHTSDSVPDLVERLRRSERVLLAVRELPAVHERHDAARRHRDAAVQRHNDARDALHDLREEQLAGAAGWLAAQLAEGCACPVCGSVAHPRPAPRGDDLPTRAAEGAARAQVDQAETERRQAETELTRAYASVVRLESLADGTDAEVAAGRHQNETRTVAQAMDARRRIPDLRSQLGVARIQLAECATSREAVGTDLAAAEERLRGRREEVNASAARLTARFGRGHDVESPLAAARSCHTAVSAVVTALRQVHARRESVQAATAAAAATALSDGFTDLDEARASALDERTRRRLQELVAEHDQSCRQAAGTLAEPTVAAAVGLPPPDLAGLTSRLADAVEQEQHTCEEAARVADRCRQVAELTARLEGVVAGWRPVRQAHEVADAMASLAEGTAVDNHLRMSLSAYVVAARLQQVVDAANERLVPMTSGRYTLEHTIDRSAGDRRTAAGGLGLRVRDEWTGSARDPKTLSGGETFQASLSLALGLSDVVTWESGGIELQTLFVDEGFGSLDPEALDEVMDVLDDLRAGGRTVGVVSHVEAMRERIPVQVRVAKCRTGSVVSQTM